MALSIDKAKTSGVVLLAVFLATLIPVHFAPLRSPAPNNTDAPSAAIEGIYAETHAVRGVDGYSIPAEDLVEIVAYDPTHVFVQLVAHFDNGGSCSLYGIATLENRTFVYRTRQFLSHDEPTCTLTVESTPDTLRVTDRSEGQTAGTCRAFCGVRGNLSDFAVSRKRSIVRQDITRMKSSVEFAEAVGEFNARNGVH